MGSLLQAGVRAAAFGAMVLASTAGAQAAGALAVGSCAAYGVAYDFSAHRPRSALPFVAEPL